MCKHIVNANNILCNATASLLRSFPITRPKSCPTVTATPTPTAIPTTTPTTFKRQSHLQNLPTLTVHPRTHQPITQYYTTQITTSKCYVKYPHISRSTYT